MAWVLGWESERFGTFGEEHMPTSPLLNNSAPLVDASPQPRQGQLCPTTPVRPFVTAFLRPGPGSGLFKGVLCYARHFQKQRLVLVCLVPSSLLTGFTPTRAVTNHH